MNIRSVSQLGQDKWALGIHNYKKGGFYIDIGCHDGIHENNTYLMDKYYGWNGICVDPFPKNMQERTCKILPFVVFSDEGEVQFRKSGILGGINEYINSHKNTVKNDEIITLPSITILKVLESAPPIIDYVYRHRRIRIRNS